MQLGRGETNKKHVTEVVAERHLVQCLVMLFACQASLEDSDEVLLLRQVLCLRCTQTVTCTVNVVYV